MTVQDFIDAYRGQLDAAIRRAIGNPNYDLDDDERALWIANDEGLYRWARSEGVREDDDDEDDEPEEEEEEVCDECRANGSGAKGCQCNKGSAAE